MAKGKRVVIVNDDFLIYKTSTDGAPLRMADPLVEAFGIPVVGKPFAMWSVETYAHDLQVASASTYAEGMAAISQAAAPAATLQEWRCEFALAVRTADLT